MARITNDIKRMAFFDIAQGHCQACGKLLQWSQHVVYTVRKHIYKDEPHVLSEYDLFVSCRLCANKLMGKHEQKQGARGMMAAITELLTQLGLDLEDPNLKETPRRIATMYELMTEGLKPENEPAIQIFPNDQEYDQIAIVKARFMSMCSHHFMPFFGVAYFGYVPDKDLIGLSKVRRVIDYFAHRPQLQEQLTKQVIDYLHNKLKPKGCMLVVQATHLCIAIKDNAQIDCPTSTSAIKGCFEDEAPRNEFLTLIHNM